MRARSYGDMLNQRCLAGVREWGQWWNGNWQRKMDFVEDDPALLFFFHDATASSGPPVVEASRSYSDAPHSVGLLWTSGQFDAETST
jgi:hypothetical protein